MRRGRLLRRAGLADHLDATGGVQQIGQATADDLVVVEEKDTDHVSVLPAHGPCPKGRRSRRCRAARCDIEHGRGIHWVAVKARMGNAVTARAVP